MKILDFGRKKNYTQNKTDFEFGKKRMKISTEVFCFKAFINNITFKTLRGTFWKNQKE